MSDPSLLERDHSGDLRSYSAFGNVIDKKLQSCANEIWLRKEDRDIGPRQRLRLLHQFSWLQRLARAARRPKDDVTPERSKALEVLLENLSSDRLQDDVYATTPIFA